ncbi:ATP-dependent RNA helicase [Maudiozyma humilis]|uniref:RNA helicase n=1 Tax=Maudiozyma humilis TaxID=51915 RepID=A0AAV5RSN0_MAUHU|nr:ATP-dependent RNA helicase [Kazachstania humilis]
MLTTSFRQCSLGLLYKQLALRNSVQYYSSRSARGQVSGKQLNLTKNLGADGRSKRGGQASPARSKFHPSVRGRGTPRFANKRGGKSERSKATSPDTFNYGEFGGLKANSKVNSQLPMSAKLVEKINSFDDVKLLPEVRDAVEKIIQEDSLNPTSNNGKVQPSPIQTLTIKKMSKKLMDDTLQTHVMAADTGSGKTIAYLIPMVEYLLREQIADPEWWDRAEGKAAIRSIILVPTHELVEQVYDTIQKTEEALGLHTFKWNVNTKYPDLVDAIRNRIDIMVVTPSKLLSLFNIKMISNPERLLARVKYMVVDEADTLMDQSWIEETHKIIRKMRNLRHLVFCSATIPNEFNKTLTRFYPSHEVITTNRLHKLPRKLDFKIIDSSLNPFKGSKMKALAQTLYAINKDNSEEGLQKRSIVFVNETAEVQKIVDELSQKYKLNVYGLTSKNSVEHRLETAKLFTSPPKEITGIPKETASSDIQAETKKDDVIAIPGSNIQIDAASKPLLSPKNNSLITLITTDVMARGLNFQGLRNVVLYDVPKTSIDLVHRAGRTARMGQGGRVFMIIDKKTKSWAKGVPKIIKTNKALS